MILVVTLSSLAKVFPNYDLPLEHKKSKGSMLKNEAYSFQVAYKYTEDSIGPRPVYVEIDSDLGDALSWRYVECVPCDFTMYPQHPAEGLEHPESRIFPDVLRPGNTPIWITEKDWRSLWFTIDGTKKTLKAGIHKIKITVTDGCGRTDAVFTIDVKNKVLPKQKIRVTNWFHCDALCQYYNVQFASDRFWQICESFMQKARDYGINMILTPLFTPPLDTFPGNERLTTQLVGVKKDGKKYTFDFRLLKRWISMCKRVGIEYYELSHLFTQWGAAHAPKIIANVGGKYQRIFGWETDSHGEEYKDFLRQFIPQLIEVLKAEGIAKKCYFHTSDEPDAGVIDAYKECASFLRGLVKGFKTIDALSDINIYNTGCIEIPIPGIDHMDPFLKANIKERWTYYCCGQIDKVSNRFLCFPSVRNRILGMQLYKYDVEGFLQWGYNFYNSQGSTRPVDPYNTTTGGGWVPGGDTFIVYPNYDGTALPSIRMEIMRESFQDMRALQALEKKIGRDEVEKLIGKKLTFTEYSLDANKLLRIREKVNELL